MNVLRVMAMAIAGGAMLLAVSACDQQTNDNLKEQAADARNKASEAANDALAKAREGWEDLKTQYAPQIDAMNEKFTKLKTDAANYKDTELDGYIAQIDEKLSNVKGKLSETFSEEGFASLKEKVGPWIDEIKALYDKAAARLAELVKSATPGG